MNFAFMKKEFALAEGFVIPRAAGHVLSDVSIDKEGAAGLEVHVGVADVGFAFAKGFDFGAVKDEAGLHFFEDVIVVRGGAVLRDDFFAGLFGVLALFRELPGFGAWLGHNLLFYLMKRLIRMSGRAAQADEALPINRVSVGGKATELAHGTA